MLGLAAAALTLIPILPVLWFDERPVATRGKGFSQEMVVMGQE